VKKLILFIPLFLAACAIEPEITAPAQETAAVKSAVATFYRAADGGHNYRKLDAKLISAELNALLQLGEAVEKRSAREIAASDWPSDKPLLLEGAILTSIYEGYSKVLDIGNLRAAKGVYQVDVKLRYDRETEIYDWTDTVVVVHEEGRWKVDDILLSDGKESLKRNLRCFGTENLCRQ